MCVRLVYYDVLAMGCNWPFFNGDMVCLYGKAISVVECMIGCFIYVWSLYPFLLLSPSFFKSGLRQEPGGFIVWRCCAGLQGKVVMRYDVDVGCIFTVRTHDHLA
jgi:hypothetical protein